MLCMVCCCSCFVADVMFLVVAVSCFPFVLSVVLFVVLLTACCSCFFVLLLGVLTYLVFLMVDVNG